MTPDTIYTGDCRETLSQWPDACIDSIVTDPPYGLSFMGKDWDHGVPGVEFWRHALRVAKPGSHLLAFGGTRTYHRLACAIEDAGWEVRDCIMWIYGSGFPKSLDVSKSIDKAAGAERKTKRVRYSPQQLNCKDGQNERPWMNAAAQVGFHELPGDEPATDAARQWSGWGTALKPAWEPIIVARKPLIGTVAENVLRHGTGGINVDGCRVGTETWTRKGGNGSTPYGSDRTWNTSDTPDIDRTASGRWPANVIHDGSDEVVGMFPQANGSKPGTRYNGPKFDGDVYSASSTAQKEFGYGDSGSAARFFYCAKASKSERDTGCEGLEERACGLMEDDNYQWSSPRDTKRRNHHPTVKPLALMRYLCRLVTPPNGIVLDMFSGSGSTLVAAKQEGFHYVGCELNEEYVAIAKARIAAARKASPRDVQLEIDSL